MSIRRIVVVLLGLGDKLEALGEITSDSEDFRHIVSDGRIVRLAPPLDCETPEAAWLGIDPRTVSVAQGPLTVAALRLEPPEKSVHFHLSLASVGPSGIVADLADPLTPDEEAVVKPLIARLNTPTLTAVWGEPDNHALVWESGSIDLATTSIKLAAGKELHKVLPEGDGELLLRRFIDDSVNLLSELELNERREDAGRSPCNLLWPWGHGFRPPLPNLALTRGESVHFESRSVRLDGLVRLAGFTHGRRSEFGRKLRPDWARTASVVRDKSVTVVLTDQFEDVVERERWEEGRQMFEDLVERFLLPSRTLRPVRLAVVCPTRAAGQEGLGMVIESETKQDNRLPFYGRIIEDRQVPRLETWEFVERVLRP